jgi:hypothetical protein
LNSRAVEYLVVGGHAVAFHGHPRFTGDVDFLVRPTAENAVRVLDAVRAFGFGSLPLTPTDFTTPERIVQLGRPPNRIDILTSISGVDFNEAWSSRVPANIDDQPVSFLGFEALIRNKKASGRAKDQADVIKLLAIATRKNRV